MVSNSENVEELPGKQSTGASTGVIYKYRGAVIHTFETGSSPPDQQGADEHLARITKLVDAWVEGPRSPDPARGAAAMKVQTTNLQVTLFAPCRELSSQHRALSRRVGVSLIMLLIAGWCCLR